jgi:hypothetical protein
MRGGFMKHSLGCMLNRIKFNLTTQKRFPPVEHLTKTGRRSSRLVGTTSCSRGAAALLLFAVEYWAAHGDEATSEIMAAPLNVARFLAGPDKIAISEQLAGILSGRRDAGSIKDRDECDFDSAPPGSSS